MSRAAVAAFPRRVAGNPYCDLLYGRLAAEGVAVEDGAELSPRWLLRHRRRVRVLHLHWPEFYYRGPGGRVTARSAAAFAAAVLLARVLGYRLVWTVHNALPHERHPADRALRWLLVRCARVVVQSARLVRAVPGARAAAVIPHGHYIGAYPDGVGRAEARARLGLEPDARVFLCFGQVRAYKGIADLCAAFAALPGERLRLVVAGRPASPADAAAVRAAAAADPRVRPLLAFVPDDEVQVVFRAADWVVLPYREVLVSGAALLAASFGRAVVVPRRGALTELEDGGGAVAYDPTRPGGLQAALAEAARRDPAPAGAAALAAARRMEWGPIAEAYARLFRDVAAER